MLSEVVSNIAVVDTLSGLADSALFFWIKWYIITVIFVKLFYVIIEGAGDNLVDIPQTDFNQFDAQRRSAGITKYVGEIHKMPDDGGLLCEVKSGDDGHQICSPFTTCFRKPSLGVSVMLFTIYESFEESILNSDVMYSDVKDGHKGQALKIDEPVYEKISVKEEPICDLPEDDNINGHDEYFFEEGLLEHPVIPGTSVTKRRRMLKALRNLFSCFKSKTNV